MDNCIDKQSCLYTEQRNYLVRSTSVGSYGPRHEKTCLRGYSNNTGADQPAHPGSLTSPFVIRFLESIICKLDAGEISIFLASLSC